ncbi:uncharacterized protein N7487_001073 [Penicillium crustosum]|uniref:uncharacterized protein n=1 Tax=Penicillium crustosum TaxID=36656 RepID=UPI00239E0BC4|nr:uncharacterized protein N7487_001073 [Penicillium crustosum]KAJ5417523.1 hypothetical protein N7487_001073 [Penicillium crustosum]
MTWHGVPGRYSTAHMPAPARKVNRYEAKSDESQNMASQIKRGWWYGLAEERGWLRKEASPSDPRKEFRDAFHMMSDR